jgi:alpha-glucosidase
MVCDYPAAYEGEPGFEFIKNIPTTWDETKVPAAKVGAFITIARKKNDNWYIGAITNHEARTISIPLHFLGEGEYVAEIYTDANDAAINPNHLKKETRKLTAKDELQLSLSGGGGAVVRLMKKKN